MTQVPDSKLTLEGDCLVVQVPLRIRRRRGRKEIIAPEGSDDGLPGSPPRSSTNQPLALMLARAHRWQHLLESGRYASIRDLALDAGVDNSYLARVLRLTLLAPDIIASILNGTEPSALSLGNLYRAPTLWGEQRRALAAS